MVVCNQTHQDEIFIVNCVQVVKICLDMFGCIVVYHPSKHFLVMLGTWDEAITSLAS